MILTGAFVLALNCGNVFASEAGMTGESNTEATIVEENGAADNVQNPADSQVVNDQNGNSYSVNSTDVPESGDPAVEPTEPPADPPAEMKQGWQDEDGGRRYYIDNNYVVGEQNIDGSWYYFQTNGSMRTGWLKDGSKWYYLKSSGEMQTGWLKDKGIWYYLESSGAMKTSQWFQLSGKHYYVNASGELAVDTTIDGFQVDSNGARVEESPQ